MFRDGPPGRPAARFILVTEKSLGIPAIREQRVVAARGKNPRKSAVFRQFWRLPSVKPVYFMLMKIRRLNRARQTLKTNVSGGESAPGG